MPSKALSFKENGLAGVLKARSLKVPIYQRSYSWTDVQVEQFWTDLAECRGSGQPYFLGTLVMATEASREYRIIDGQQRLATCSLLLASIRDAYKSNGDGDGAKSVDGEFVRAYDRRQKVFSPKLALNTDDGQFYAQLLGDRDTPPSKNSHRLLGAAYAFLRESVESEVKENGIAILADWLDFLSSEVMVVVVDVDDEADAYLIFETLNDRGLDLSVADLLKNFLFGKAGSRLDEARDAWVRTQGILEAASTRDVFVEFLVDYWGSRFGHTRRRDLYRDIRNRTKTSDEAVALASELENAASHYSAILNGDHSFWEGYDRQIPGYLDSLHILGVKQMRPLMLAVLENLDTKQVERFFRLSVAWTVRRLAAGLRGGTQEKLFCDVAMEVRSGQLKKVTAILTRLGSDVPSDSKFESDFAKLEVTKAAVARYYLQVLEEQVTKEVLPDTNPRSVNLEHILPVNWATGDWKSFSKDKDSDLFVNRLGNLALLSKRENKTVGRAGFRSKRETLSKSAIVLTQEVGKQDTWTKQQVEDRQSRLAKLAPRAWPRS
jgi:uncharacterized protein DUF262/uncharacterized protein DUF1524